MQKSHANVTDKTSFGMPLNLLKNLWLQIGRSKKPEETGNFGARKPKTSVFSQRLYRIKEPAIKVAPVSLRDRIECDEIFVQYVQQNEYLGNASKLLQRVPLLFFYFLNATYKGRRD